MSTQDLARREPTDIALADNIQILEGRFTMAVRQRELLESYIKMRLKPGKHFYRVSDDQKPSLTKEGAELICLPHTYKPRYFIQAGPDQPPEDDSPYQITVLCRLQRGEEFSGEALGSASSHITTKSGERKVRQKDIGLRHNATLKMAQKSAYIAATLNATAASEFFTQDIEDFPDAPSRSEAFTSSPRYCTEHQAAWFKKGKMKGYSHPTDGGGWCNMPKPAPASPETAPVVGAPVDTVPEEPETPTDVSEWSMPKNMGELFTWALKAYGLKKPDTLKLLGVEDQMAIADIGQAWQTIVYHKEQDKAREELEEEEAP
ncbi:MAG: hypothetical protein V3W51_04625 [Candidatus Brocadiales bacterium]